MNTALQKDCATECFYDVEKLIYSTIHRFIRTYGGDFEEMKSVAFLAYVEAFEQYDSERTSFHKFIGNRVYHALGDFYRKDLRWNRCRPEDLEKRHGNYTDGIVSLLCDLDNDAKTIVSLLFRTPRKLLIRIRNAGGGNENVKKILTEYLKEDGWTRQEIAHGYKQITRAVF